MFSSRLFKIDGVKLVFLADDFLTITKVDEYADWATMKPEIFSIITDHFASGRAVLKEGALNADSGVFCILFDKLSEKMF